MKSQEDQQQRAQRLKRAAVIAIALAVPAEGLRLWAYNDTGGILTVCYGSTTDVVKGKKYSLQECRDRLDNDMLDAIRTVDRCAPGLPDHVLAAFADAVYNMGPKIACDKTRSTAARLLAQRKLTQACKELPKWNKASVGGEMVPLPGLTKRRKAEMELCLGEDDGQSGLAAQETRIVWVQQAESDPPTPF